MGIPEYLKCKNFKSSCPIENVRRDTVSIEGLCMAHTVNSGQLSENMTK